MPRPGPRPYECVKRAWHSDRHQPIRGSLIREIFRIANEIHSPTTRKNKEWQEKLPSVVLKAEEIMYSKANSEAEYVDLNTLWERANDAIDTIIRRDDIDEPDNLLQPCIEAALTLGCVPRRASRSQRHNNPRCYLSTTPQEAAKSSISPRHILQGSNSQLVAAAYLLQPPLLGCPGNIQKCSSQCVPWVSTMSSQPTLASDCHVVMRCANVVPSISENDAVPAFRYGIDDSPLLKREKALFNTCKQASFGRVYNLYYGADAQNVESCSSFLGPLGSSCNDVTVGSPVCDSSVRELDAQIIAGSKYRSLNDPSNLRNVCGSTGNIECDLSLHLGLPSLITPPVEDNAWVPEVEDMGSSSSLDGSKFHGPSQSQPVNSVCLFSSQNHKGPFLPYMDGLGDPLESCSSKRSLEDDDTLYVETSQRKRKALHDDLNYGYLQFKITPPTG